MMHERRAYNIVNMIKDFGGFFQGIKGMFTIFLKPISEHNMLILALAKVFNVSTGDQTLFNKKNKRKSNTLIDRKARVKAF